MAGKSLALSPDHCYSPYGMKDERDENDLRNNHNNPKIDVPKKKTTFKITSVTKSSQRGGSGDLTQENDLDSQDDLDETVDSHTEDLSSEIYDTSSKATDIDVQEPPLTPEEFIRETEHKEKPEELNKENEPKEKPARFKVVKVETKEPFKRGRWVCCDYLDAPEKSESKQDEVNVKSGSSSTVNSVHYVHGVDDPSKNPLLAGATGTTSSHPQPLRDASASTLNSQGEIFKPIHPASSQTNMTPASQSSSSFSNKSAQSSASLRYAAQPGIPEQSLRQSFPVINNLSLISGSTVPTLPPLQQGQTQTSQSLSGNIPFPSGQTQHLPTPQGSTLSSSLHSQSASKSGSAKSPLQAPMQTGEFVNSVGKGQTGASKGQPVSALQQPRYNVSSQQPGYNLTSGAVSAVGNVGDGVPSIPPHRQQNPIPASGTSQYDGYRSDNPRLSLSGSTLSSLIPARSEAGEEARSILGAGLAPLEIAVGGITSCQTADDDMTEEAVSQSNRQLHFASRRPSLRTQVRNHIGSIHSGTSAVAIDNKIEQAMVSLEKLEEKLAETQSNNESLTDKLEYSMDLVKSHLMYAVREEVEVLKELIKELMERMHKAEHENMVLRNAATPETLAKLPPPLPPVQNPLLQQFMVSLHTPSSS